MIERPQIGSMGYNHEEVERRQDSVGDRRHPFERDYDRLIHKPAFRRLQGKTQVVTPGQADFFRTRLTHTLEVAQIGRRIAQDLRVHPDAVEAAALLHDLGHPPFGHSGEQALAEAVDAIADDWGLKTDTEDLVGGFEGNAQSFRIAARDVESGGMNLTRTVLDGAVKYPWARGCNGPKSERKWCFYPTESVAADWLRRGVPEEQPFAVSLEAQVMDWADDVAYAIHDIEDWHKAGYMPLALLKESRTHREHLVDRLVSKWRVPGTDPRPHEPLAHGHDGQAFTRAEVDSHVEQLFGGRGRTDGAFSFFNRDYDGSHEAKGAVTVMRKTLYKAFMDPTMVKLRYPPRTSVACKRYGNELWLDREIRLTNDIVRQMAWIYVIDQPRMMTVERGERCIVSDLMAIHAQAACSGIDLAIFPEDNREAIKELTSAFGARSPELLRLVCDYVAGMTDAYATRIHGRLTGRSLGAYNDFV